MSVNVKTLKNKFLRCVTISVFALSKGWEHSAREHPRCTQQSLALLLSPARAALIFSCRCRTWVSVHLPATLQWVRHASTKWTERIFPNTVPQITYIQFSHYWPQKHLPHPLCCELCPLAHPVLQSTSRESGGVTPHLGELIDDVLLFNDL